MKQLSILKPLLMAQILQGTPEKFLLESRVLPSLSELLKAVIIQ